MARKESLHIKVFAIKTRAQAREQVKELEEKEVVRLAWRKKKEEETMRKKLKEEEKKAQGDEEKERKVQVKEGDEREKKGEKKEEKRVLRWVRLKGQLKKP